MTLADIDKALAHWESRLSSAAHNLFDLQSDPTYQCLTGTFDAPKTQLSGMTANRVLPVLENIGTLFSCFDLLRCTIDRVVQIRRELPAMFGAEQKEREIQQLLFGKSVRIPTDQIPIARRSLLTGADDQGCITPDELLKSMVKAFDAARDAVLAVDTAWQRLGEILGDATRQLTTLRRGTEPLEEAEVHELDGVEHSLALRKAQVQSDPLGTTLDVESTVLPVLRRVQAGVSERIALRRQLEDGLSAAHKLLEDLGTLQRDACDAWKEAQEKITGAGQPPAPSPDEKIEALRDWLDKLQQKYEGGMLRPVSIGLHNWNQRPEIAYRLYRRSMPVTPHHSTCARSCAAA